MATRIGKSYLLLTTLSAAFGVYTIAGQILMGHAFPGAWFYARTLASIIGSGCLLVSLIRIRDTSLQIISVGAIGSVLLILAIVELLIEITPVAQGNNDSGEIFPFLAIPFIVFFLHVSVAYLRAVARKPEQITQA